jgi:hypothetical protein
MLRHGLWMHLLAAGTMRITFNVFMTTILTAINWFCQYPAGKAGNFTFNTDHPLRHK